MATDAPSGGITARARLYGLVSPDSVRRIFYPGDPPPGPDFDPSTLPLEIGDARRLQAGAASEAACFEEHGFVLLDHDLQRHDHRPDRLAAEDYARLYHEPVEALIRERLFPGQRVEILQPMKPVCRGQDEEAVYATWVHQDFGLTADDFERNLAGIVSPEAAVDWRGHYDREDVVGCIAISIWRTIGMQGPLLHMPLALCDPGSVEMADVVNAAAAADGGHYHIGLRYNAGQNWYHYPALREDELLAFKLFECRKEELEPDRLRSVFHAAFEDPAAPADAERRQSCEHPAIALLLAD